MVATAIRFTDSYGLEKGIGIFRRYGDAVPTGEPDTYYVSDRMVELLERELIPFERVDPEKYGLMRVTEEMFESLRKAVEDSHQGKLIRVKDPKSLDDIIKAGRDLD